MCFVNCLRKFKIYLFLGEGRHRSVVRGKLLRSLRTIGWTGLWPIRSYQAISKRRHFLPTQAAHVAHIYILRYSTQFPSVGATRYDHQQPAHGESFVCLLPPLLNGRDTLLPARKPRQHLDSEETPTPQHCLSMVLQNPR